MNDIIAILTVNQQNRTIVDIKITQKQFKFKCKRNATLCCKLGGPTLTKKDITKIQSAGHSLEDFIQPPKNDATNCIGSLKTRTDGSCIFLKHDKQQNKQNCEIYDFRPALCKIYPFHFEPLGPDKVALKLIPCCLGLNNPEGKDLDEKFISSVLLEPLLDVIELIHNNTS